MSLDFHTGNRDGRGERFSRPLVSLGVALVFLLLLFVLFPKKDIEGIVSRSPESASVAMGYRKAMLRVRPQDTKLRLDLAEGLVKTDQDGKALAVLNEIREIPTGSESTRYLEIRYRALLGILSQEGGDRAKRHLLTEEFSLLTRNRAERVSTTWELSRMVTETKGLLDGPTASWLQNRYEVALHSGTQCSATVDAEYYRKNAQLCFVAMQKEGELARRRMLFIQGVGFLRAGNLGNEALAAGTAHLDDLAADRDTLLFMTKTALAAGKPGIAERYVRMALRMEPKRERLSGK